MFRSDMELIAIDPGEVHCGLAFFKDGFDTPTGWRCVHVEERSPWTAVDLIMERTVGGKTDFLVWERFRLYEDLAVTQKGSEFTTVQIIGVLRWLVRHIERRYEYLERVKRDRLPTDWSIRWDLELNSFAKPVVGVGYFADVKEATAGHCRRYGIKSVAKSRKLDTFPSGTRDHCYDAELLGWHHILRTGLSQRQTP